MIQTLAGKPVKDGHELQTIVAGLPLGKPVEVNVLRDGKPQQLSVTIEEQPSDFGTVRVPVRRAPDSEADAVKLEKIGVEVSDLTPETAEQLGYPEQTRGALITKVDSDGLAAPSGLRRGMVVTKVDRKPVASAKALQEGLASASLDKGVLLQVQSPQGGTNYVLLKTGVAVRQ